MICVRLWHFLLAFCVPPICHQAFLLPSSLTNDLQEVASSYQLYASLIAGAEAVVHAIKTSFLWDDTDSTRSSIGWCK